MAIGFKGLKAMFDFNREQDSIEKDELERNLCPDCNWTLKTNEDGELSCEMCGKVYDSIY